MATKKPKKSIASTVSAEPTVTVGSHLTVTTYPDGRTELLWDDDALMRDVRAALATVTVEAPKKTRAKKAKA